MGSEALVLQEHRAQKRRNGDISLGDKQRGNDEMNCENKTYAKSILEWALNKRIFKGVLMCPECHKKAQEGSKDANQTRKQRQVPEGLEDKNKTGHP